MIPPLPPQTIPTLFGYARQARKLQLLTSSRVVAIELMSVAMACQEFHTAEQAEFRNRIIGVFFKNLTLRSKEIVLVSKKGLSHVIVLHKLPKVILLSPHSSSPPLPNHKKLMLGAKSIYLSTK